MTPAFHMIPADQMPLGDAPLAWPVRPPTLHETLAISAQVGERFVLTMDGHDRPDYLPACALSDDDLLNGISKRGNDVGTTENRVAAALFLQGYAYRVAAPMLAAWVLHGRIPDVSAANLVLRFNDTGRLQDVAMRVPRVFALPDDRLDDAEVIHVSDLTGAAIETLLSGHLLAVMERVRPFGKLGLPLAKGSVASQIGMALTYIDGQSGQPWQLVARIALDFLGRTKAQIAGQGVSGSMHFKQAGCREGVTFCRGTCCLVYRAPGKEYCGGCPLRSESELQETWQTRLLARPAECLVTPAGRCQSPAAG